MLIGRALWAKVRPPRLNPRELQEQLDITRAAVLTSCYSATQQRHRQQQQQQQQQQHDHEDAQSSSYERLEKEIGAMKPMARKRRAQTAINDQVVKYFALVHAAQTATPPPVILNSGGSGSGSGGGGGPVDEVVNSSAVEESGEGTTTTTTSASSPSSSSDTLHPRGVREREAERSAEQKAIEAWRRKLLREMLRSELGFNIVVKESGLAGAGGGLGLFVEGTAPEGAVVAIYPGYVHLPENLRNQKYADALLPDDEHFLMGRADGSLVDGRTAGLLPSSPLTFAHAANHPPRGEAANVLQVAYDYPALSDDDVGIAKGGRFPKQLRPLIPNRYFRQPKAVFGGKLDQSAMVETVVLVACRGGLRDQEAFMDYRFNPKMPLPDWYSPVDPAASAKMWAEDNRDSAAQSLLDFSRFRRRS